MIAFPNNSIRSETIYCSKSPTRNVACAMHRDWDGRDESTCVKWREQAIAE